ncbi:MAG: LytR/AlgR family response regulator transcription factor [Thermonemataceae bacterium]
MRYLYQPYPRSFAWQSGVKKALLYGLVVCCVLTFLRPFGLHTLSFSTLLVNTLQFGGITAIAIVFTTAMLPHLLPYHFNEDRWRVYKEIIFILFNILLVGFLNTAFLYQKGTVDVSFNEALLWMTVNTLLVAIIPVSIFVFVNQNIRLKQHLAQAKQFNEQLDKKEVLAIAPTTSSPEQIVLLSEKEKPELRIIMTHLLYFTAAGNYVDVFYLNDAQEVQRLTIRNRLKALYEQLPPTLFYFCHRSYVVSLHHLVRVHGNARNYEIQLRHVTTRIPVSRNKSDELMEKIAIT